MSVELPTIIVKWKFCLNIESFKANNYSQFQCKPYEIIVNVIESISLFQVDRLLLE